MKFFLVDIFPIGQVALSVFISISSEPIELQGLLGCGNMRGQDEVAKSASSSLCHGDQLDAAHSVAIPCIQNKLVTRDPFLKDPKSTVPGGATAKLISGGLEQYLRNSISIQINELYAGFLYEQFQIRVRLYVLIVHEGLYES